MYHLKLTNSGPVVLDSIIDFRAQMFDEKGHVADPKLFLYIWQNNATFRDLRTVNGFDANLTKQVFSTFSVDPRIYTMQVCVYDRETKSSGIIKHTRVAQGRSKFVLTGKNSNQRQMYISTSTISVADMFKLTDHACGNKKYGLIFSIYVQYLFILN